ncbi:MAG: LytTR family DNA-binding domain-containing protein [Bacteroidota bacterium]
MHYPLARSFRAHFLLGLGVSVWLYLFLSLIGPFDAAELSLRIRIILMTGYGLVFLACYLAACIIQTKLSSRTGSWTAWQEIWVMVVFLLFGVPTTFMYYTSGWVNGDWPFPKFLLQIYLPTIALVLPFLMIGRYFLGRQEERSTAIAQSKKPTTIKGNSRLDHISLEKDELVAISAAGNYCTVFFKVGERVEKKLIRISLRQAHEQASSLVKIHRSHLINPLHFTAWTDEKTILVGEMKLPVSTKYKKPLRDMFGREA